MMWLCRAAIAIELIEVVRIYARRLRAKHSLGLESRCLYTISRGIGQSGGVYGIRPRPVDALSSLVGRRSSI
jgi:hypothetical protein